MLIQITYTMYTLTSQRTQLFCITKTNKLIIYTKVITVDSENRTKCIKRVRVDKMHEFYVTCGGIYNYQWFLNG